MDGGFDLYSRSSNAGPSGLRLFFLNLVHDLNIGPSDLTSLPNSWKPVAGFPRMESLFATKRSLKMHGAMGNGQDESNQSMICGSEMKMSEFSETAHEMGRKIADAAAHAGDYIEEKAGVLGDKLKDLQGKDFREIADEAKDYARRKPGHAILISAAAGLVLGFLLRSGRRVF
jgi:ElaB/YqjD/DUF883 family membrane-anchored ribosome-binding protein